MKRAFAPMLALILTVAPAAAFRAQNDMIVEPRGQNGFHVAYRGGRAGAPDFWCAAGDYVVRDLGRSPGTPIYRTTSTPRRAGHGLDFSLSPDGAKRTGLVTIFGSRTSVTAGAARALCNLRNRAFRD
jgi:hypothetical protein